MCPLLGLFPMSPVTFDHSFMAHSPSSASSSCWQARCCCSQYQGVSRKGYDSLLYQMPSLQGHLELSQSARKIQLISMCWKIPQATQYTGSFLKELLSMSYSRTWPQSMFEEYRNTVNLIGILSARKFTAFPKYDHESNGNNQLPWHTLQNALF